MPSQAEKRKGEVVSLEREYLVCPQCGVGFFPLDEELGLLDSRLSPDLIAKLERLIPSPPE
jgi:hypothetical protein